MPHIVTLTLNRSTLASNNRVREQASPAATQAREISKALSVEVPRSEVSLASRLKSALDAIPLATLTSFHARSKNHVGDKLLALQNFSNGSSNRSLSGDSPIHMARSKLLVAASAFLGGGLAALDDVDYKTRQGDALNRWRELPPEERTAFARQSELNASLVALFDGLAQGTHQIAPGASREAMTSIYAALTARGLSGVTESLTALASFKEIVLNARPVPQKRKLSEASAAAGPALRAAKRRRHEQLPVPFLLRNLGASKHAAVPGARRSLQQLSRDAFTSDEAPRLLHRQGPAPTRVPPALAGVPTAVAPSNSATSTAETRPAAPILDLPVLGGEELAQTLAWVREAVESAERSSCSSASSTAPNQENNDGQEIAVPTVNDNRTSVSPTLTATMPRSGRQIARSATTPSTSRTTSAESSAGRPSETSEQDTALPQPSAAAPSEPTVQMRTASLPYLGRVTLPLVALRALVSPRVGGTEASQIVRVTTNGLNLSLALSTLQALIRPDPLLGVAVGSPAHVGCSLGELVLSFGLLGKLLAQPPADEASDDTYEMLCINGVEVGMTISLLREIMDDNSPGSDPTDQATAPPASQVTR